MPGSRSSRSAASTPDLNVKSPVAVQGCRRCPLRAARRGSRRSAAPPTWCSGGPLMKPKRRWPSDVRCWPMRTPAAALVDPDRGHDRARLLARRNGDDPHARRAARDSMSSRSSDSGGEQDQPGGPLTLEDASEQSAGLDRLRIDRAGDEVEAQATNSRATRQAPAPHCNSCSARAPDCGRGSA